MQNVPRFNKLRVFQFVAQKLQRKPTMTRLYLKKNLHFTIDFHRKHSKLCPIGIGVLRKYHSLHISDTTRIPFINTYQVKQIFISSYKCNLTWKILYRN